MGEGKSDSTRDQNERMSTRCSSIIHEMDQEIMKMGKIEKNETILRIGRRDRSESRASEDRVR